MPSINVCAKWHKARGGQTKNCSCCRQRNSNFPFEKLDESYTMTLISAVKNPILTFARMLLDRPARCVEEIGLGQDTKARRAKFTSRPKHIYYPDIVKDSMETQSEWLWCGRAHWNENELFFYSILQVCHYLISRWHLIEVKTWWWWSQQTLGENEKFRV